jgi:hypothetical protein
MVRQADHIFISMIREWNLYDKISQAFAALDTSKAVGVMVSTSFKIFLFMFLDLVLNANLKYRKTEKTSDFENTLYTRNYIDI